MARHDPRTDVRLCPIHSTRCNQEVTLMNRCDADPVALANFVEALLMHEADMGEEDWKIVS